MQLNGCCVFVCVVVIIVLMMAVSPSLSEQASPTSTTPFAVFGYLPEYRLNNFNYTAAFNTGLTHLIFFSLEIGPDGLPSALDRLPSKAQAQEARDAAGPDRKLLLSFGGNSRSWNFGMMATDATRRRNFLRALKALLVEYNLDGVDYNWEYPANTQEWSAWRELMKESKEIMSIVTFTIYVDERHYEIIQRFGLVDVADYVLCMVYDQPGEHSTMALHRHSIQLAHKHKIPLNKFAPGVPFYARHVHHGEPKTYYEIVDEVTKLKSTSSPPEINQIGLYYFNSQDMIARKTRYTMNVAGCGGIMIWEIGQDVQPMSDPRSLMYALNASMSSRGDGGASSSSASASASSPSSSSSESEYDL
eukprot:PhM_4_TR13772/c0_g1_i1/m.105217/K01183/E3.2.1.14; chitinase